MTEYTNQSINQSTDLLAEGSKQNSIRKESINEINAWKIQPITAANFSKSINQR